MSDLHDLTALHLAAALRGGEVSAREVIDHTLDRARRLGPRVGAFVHLAEERARAGAHRADAALARHRAGEIDAGDLPPLLGVPVPVKDLNQVAGLPFEAGSAALRGTVAEVDDGVVTALAEAGTVMPGKTTTPEFGLPPYTEPDIAPPARTPWDLRRSAGGSSGGAAAAVAARIVPAAHASDGGGSIRIPAACTGLVGLKPSSGLVSSGPYGVDGFGLATGGALTRDVRDTAAMLDALSRPWPGDGPRPSHPGGGYLDAMGHLGSLTEGRRLRVGVLRAPVIVDEAEVHPEAWAALDRAVALLAAMGNEIVEAPHPMRQADWEVFMPIWAMGALAAPVPEDAEDALAPLTRWLREQARSVTGLQLAQAFTGLQLLRRRIAERWAGIDVVVSPTLAGPPAPIGFLRNDADPAADFFAQRAYTPWTSLWNITGAPAISLPLHRAEMAPADEGQENRLDPHPSGDEPRVLLPFAVMLGMPHGRDAELLGLAARLEEMDPWPLPPQVTA